MDFFCFGWGSLLVLNKQQSIACTNDDQVSWPRTVSHTTMSQIQFKINHDDVNTLRMIQNGRHFTDDIFMCISKYKYGEHKDIKL